MIKIGSQLLHQNEQSLTSGAIITQHQDKAYLTKNEAVKIIQCLLVPTEVPVTHLFEVDGSKYV